MKKEEMRLLTVSLLVHLKKKKKSSFCLVDQQVSNGFQWKNKLQ